MNASTKKCSLEAWYDVQKKKQKNLLNLRIINQKEYDMNMKKVCWEYWERLERIDCGEK